MNNHVLLPAVFLAGLGIGWFGNAWVDSSPSTTTTRTKFNSHHGANPHHLASQTLQQYAESTPVGSTSADTSAANAKNSHTQPLQPEWRDSITRGADLETFNTRLNDRAYREAIGLYQELDNQNSPIIAQLKISLLKQLELLTKTQSYNDFLALIDQYLSVYYDDVEVLLLLADFNHANGNYLEVVDVYLLARTYAYNDTEHQKVLNRFNAFVKDIDRWYTSQENWLLLITFYSHISTSGLMTPIHQYRQALAHLRNGDEEFAIAQFNQLLGDTVAGESAAQALEDLQNHSVAPPFDSSTIQGYNESIALQPIGNQYAVALTNNRQEKINLLIDTGASMTALSSASFHSLGIDADAVEQDRRVFRTAGGVVMGTVYTIPELQLGPYPLRDTRIAVIDFPTHREIDGLLGMNILGEFRFHIDQENNELQLTRE